MKTQEEIEQLAIKWYTEKHEVVPKIIETESFIKGYTQCQEDMADKIKEAYIQGLLEGYACMPSIEGMPSINSLNKQD